MRTTWILATALMVTGCKGGDDESGDTNDSGGGGAAFEDFINVTDEALGDFTGFTAGTWNTQDVDEAKQVTIAGIVGTVVDFESGDEVAEAHIDIFESDSASGVPDISEVSDENGQATLDLPGCSPLSYKVWTNPDLGATKDTYEAHQMFQEGDAETEFNSVSSTTYQIIPSLLAVQVEPDKGVIAGTAYDSIDGPVEHAQVVVRDENGEIPESLIVKYFVNSFPNRDQPNTSEDGLWVAINVPEGELTAEAWAVVNGELVQIGATKLRSYADSINISNIYAGYETGVKYPESCLAASE